ncbi:Lytic polysaccharide monooxygenase [Mycena indigotica]|uniref:lytic cellulose monooxygenase (C4-dehydrogenating) n=1 Tax=Mycena indigotica TaxID=2126181 RepID=A0A8H6RXT2_9AGAR|nr:Lytic polysaccharide monooxygenase [Mycena indigotica]KAF7289745.1 Lytic polysaccharide monooxygenase [Mycena indigotica]
MKSFLSIAGALLLAATQVSSHYTWPDFIVNGSPTSDWQYVRKTNNYQDLNPQTDVTSNDIRCYNTQKLNTPSTVSVAAGSKVGFTVSGNPASLYHAGVLNVYMAKAPSGTDVASWDPTGAVWFKVYQISAVTDGGSTITFPTTNMTQISFTIPAATPSGQYLIRTEHIAIHSASYYGGAQFYIACAQVTVTNGGSGTPGPLVAFPGAYTGNEPGILINIYYPIPTTYVQPGPAVWTGGSSGGGVTTTNGGVTTTQAPPTTTIKTSATVSATSAPGTVAQYQQCGGQGYTGATACVSPFKCTVVNTYYSQCL